MRPIRILALPKYWVILCMIYLLSVDFFFKINFFEKLFQEYNQSVKQFGSRRFIGPDLGPNCLRRFQQPTLVGKELMHSV